MRHHKFSAEQIAANGGFTDLFVVGVATPGQTPASTTAPNDFSQGFSNKQIALDALDVGDFVHTARTLIEIKTAFAGPTGTPTVSVGINGAVTQFTAAQGVAGTPVVYQGPGAAQPYPVTAAKTLQVDCQVGGGDGAVPTAGELFIWMAISRINERPASGQA